MTLRLTSRIVLFFLLLAAGLLVIVGVLSYRSASESLERAAMTDMLGNVIEKEAQLDMWIEERLDELGLISRQAAVVEKTATLIGAVRASERARSARALLMGELQPHLDDGHSHFSEFFVMDPEDGRVVASTSPAEEGKLKFGQPYFDRGKTDLYVQAPYYSADLAGPAMTAVVPLRAAGGRVVAVLAARLDLAAINVIVRRRTGLHETEDSFLVNAEQYLVTQPRFIREPAMLRRKIDTEAVRRSVAGNNGVTVTPDYRGVPSIAAYRWDARHQLGVIVKMDHTEALAPARAFGRSVVLISSLALLAAAGLALLLAHSITRPVRMLHERVRRFGGEHSDEPSPTSAGDEVIALAGEFDQLAARIGERTAELTKTNDALRTESRARTQAETEVHRTHAELEHMVTHSPAIIYRLRVEGDRIIPIAVNANITGLLGFSPAEAMSYEWWTGQLHPDDRDRALASIGEVLTQGTSRTEYRMRHKDGGYRWVDDSRRSLRDASGRPIEIVGAWMDATDRKEAEESLGRLTRLHETILDSAASGIHGIGADGRILFENPAAVQMLGWEAAELVGQPAHATMHHTRADGTAYPVEQCHIHAALRDGRTRHVTDEVFWRKDGSSFPVEYTVASLRGEREAIVGAVVLFADTTVRSQADLALRESEERFRDLFENSSDLIQSVSPDGRFIFVNRSWHDSLGYGDEELGGLTIFDIIHPDSLDDCLAFFRRVMAGEDVTVETALRAKDGRTVLVEGRAHCQFKNGRPIATRAIFRDVTERRQAEASLAESTAQLDIAKRGLQALLDAATEISIIATDTEGRITVFNPGAERMLGYRSEEMVHVRTPEILHDAEECLDRSRQLTMELGRPVEGFDVFVEYAREHPFDEREWTYVRKDGSRLDVNLIVTAVRDSQGLIAGYLGIATDITERKRLEIALRLNNQKLEAQTRLAEEANRAKSDFLATMSHEIRTPMNGVVGMTELLLHTDLSAEQREYAQFVSRSADSLLTVINDILDFSKVESGKLDLETIDFGLRAVLEEAAALLAERAQSRGLEMACDIPQDIPEVVCGDPGRLRQIVTNLLGNAIKFTEAGEVVLRARVVADSGDDVTIRVEITDTGVGISPDVQGRLFQSFSQADSSTTRRFGGTGLGLAISKRLAELMGGAIGVESEPGNGSTFWFTVRLGKALAAPAASPSVRAGLTGLRALAVDDNHTNLQLVSAQTRAWGMVCDVCTTGVEALQKIGAASLGRPYDVAILDMQMPGMDGLELAEAIKRDPSNMKIQLVLMTSMAERGHAIKAQQLGIAAYLTKPVRQSQLYDCLTTVVGPSSHTSAEVPAQPSRIAPTRSPVQGQNPGRPRALLAEDNPTNQMAAARMLEILGYQVDVAINGIEAVEACRKVDYRIVLMDNQMPEMDGLAAAREVRTFELAHGKQPVPIIALTANAMQGDREKCLAAGMTDYLSKPFKLGQLRTLLERWGDVSGVVAAGLEDVATLRHEPAIDSSVFDEFRALGAGSGASDFVAELIGQYLAESTSRIATLKDALNRGDAPALQRATHSLRGSSGTVGANRMADLCRQLETLARRTTLDGSPALVAALDEEFERVGRALLAEQPAQARQNKD